MSEEQHAEQLEVKLKHLVEQWAEGRILLKQVVGLSDAELYTLSTQGYLLFLQGKAQAAKIIFEGLIAMDPRNVYYYRALGVIYWHLKEAQKAINQFSYAIRVAPKEMLSYINRAEVYVATKQYDLAYNDLNQALEFAGLGDTPLIKKARAILQMLPENKLAAHTKTDIKRR